MADVNAFIDAIGKDVSATVAPGVETLAGQIGTRTFTEYGPRVSAFATQLVTDIIHEQSASVRDFATSTIQALFERYRPELIGEVQARIVRDGVELNGRGIRLDLKRRDTGAVVSSLDIPVSVTIRIPELGVTLENATVKLDVVS